MSFLRNILIVVSFFFLWVSSLIGNETEILIGFSLILSFGILHGSNDILLVEKTNIVSNKISYIKILAAYIGFVLLSLLAFYTIPLIILIVFVLFSAYHFGEQHWSFKHPKLKTKIKSVLYTLYGSFVLVLLFRFNLEETTNIISTIIEIELTPNLLINFFNVSLIILGIALILVTAKTKLSKSDLAKELLYLIVFSIIFLNTSLIWGFAIYFILWHSIPSLYDQILFIYGNVKTKSTLHYTKKALPYWLISLVGIASIYFIFKDLDIFYALFFSILAAVTFPHSLIIHKMFKIKTDSKN